MMKRTNQLLLLVGLLAMQPLAQAGDLFAVQVERAETASHGTIEHAVILIDDGKIVMIGEDLAIAVLFLEQGQVNVDEKGKTLSLLFTLQTGALLEAGTGEARPQDGGPAANKVERLAIPALGHVEPRQVFEVYGYNYTEKIDRSKKICPSDKILPKFPGLIKILPK
mgnify:CR=1 FL=1